MKLDGAVVVITGASRGIGKAFADALSAEGATVVGCALNAGDGIESVDVGDSDALEAFLESVQEKHGAIDILINNAGINHKFGFLEDLDPSLYHDCMRINTESVYTAMRAVLPSMKERNSGVIINIASNTASSAHPRLPFYTVCKFAVLGLTQVVAKNLLDLELDVTCFSVSPKGVDTDMRRALASDDGRVIQSAERVAKCVLPILQGEKKIENGVDIKINDGEITEIVTML